MAALRAVEVRNRSCITPRFNFLLGVILLLLFPIRTFAADPTMTLLKRESQPISEGQTIIRSQYLCQPPAIAGVQLPATTVTKEIVVVGCGVNYDANRGVGQPRWMPSNGALVVAGRAGVAYESTAGPLEFYLPVAGDQWLVVRKNGRVVSSRLVGAAAATAIKSDDRTARYVNVFPDTDLVWQVGNGYLKESLILRSRTAPTEFSFLLESPDFAFLASDASQSTFSLNEIRPTAQAFVEKELPSIAERMAWLSPGRISWGTHKKSEPLVLQTGGYGVAGELTYGGVPLLHDSVIVTILGDAIEYVAVTCHDIIEIARDSVTVISCASAVEKALPAVKTALRLEDGYVIVGARVVLAGPLELESGEASQERLEYRPMWEVIFQPSPGSCACEERIVYLDAATGDYVGQGRR